MMRVIFFLLSFLTILTTYAQQKRKINIEKTNAPITIDGVDKEKSWKKTKTEAQFLNKSPIDVGLAEAKTEVKLLYDDKFLYVFATCYTVLPYVIQTLKRDIGHWDSDGFAVVLDPINNQSNGFIFGVNAGGAQMEGLISGSVMANNWDTKWFSAIKSYPDKWTIEIAIPFKSIRYNDNVEWGINFIRNDMKRNIYSTWNKVPLQIFGLDLGFTGRLQWDVSPPKQKNNNVIIPYVSIGSSRDYEEGEPNQFNYGIGLDAKISLTSSLNLDLTVNPDFSQVDVDRQVTNLTRFNVFFPERRNFFLENSDIFSDFGIYPVRPFFSRRIGIEEDEILPIYFGARLTGNVTQSTRIGSLLVQTGEKDVYKGQNYFITAVHQRVLKRSKIKGIFINRMAMMDSEKIKFDTQDFNRVMGVEADYLSQNGIWGGKATYLLSQTEDKFNKNGFWSLNFTHNAKKLNAYVGINQLGTNFISDLGFFSRLDNYDVQRDTTVRIGYTQTRVRVRSTFLPKNQSSKLANHGFFVVNNSYFRYEDNHFVESNGEVGYYLYFRNRSSIDFGVNYVNVNLFFPLDLIEVGKDYIPKGNYSFASFWLSYESDSRKLFSYELAAQYGSLFNGNRFRSRANLFLRKQPWGKFGVNTEFNYIQLPERYGNAFFMLISPSIEINFSNNIFWTTFLQYNTQGNNFNLNTRFQWRFKPMSDLFVVYSDNYTADGWMPKNRAIIIKVTYWLNL